MSEPVPAPALSIPPDMLDELRVHIDAGNPILAIRNLRRVLGCNIATSKCLIEEAFGPLATRIEPQPDGSVRVTGPGACETTAPSPAEPRFVGQSGGTILLRMPSTTRDSGFRVVALDEVDAVFGRLEHERRQTGEDEESIAETLDWLIACSTRLDALESAFLAVNELCPPSDWLRDLKAALSDTDALYALRDRAQEVATEGLVEAAKQVPLPFALGCGPLIVSGGPRVDVVHGVRTDDPELAAAVMHLANGNDPAAVEDVAARFELSALEAEQVLDALAREGKATSCYLDGRGRLVLVRGGEVTGYEVDVRIPPGGFTPPDAPAQPKVAHFDGSDGTARIPFGGWFDRVTVQIREPGKEDQPSRRDIDGFKITHASINADGAIGLGGHVVRPSEPTQPDPRRHCQTCAHAGAYTCDLLGSMRSEALTWRTKNTTGDGCPGWEAKAETVVEEEIRPDWLPDGWTYRLGAYNGPDGCKVFMHGNGTVDAWGPRRGQPDDDASELQKKAMVLALAHPEWVLNPPTFFGLAHLKADGFLQELNRLVLHPAGRALGFTLDDDGRVIDVWVNPSDDPAGWAFIPDDDDAEFQANAANVARETEARRRARLADPDLGSVVELVPGDGPRWESVAMFGGPADHAELRRRAESWLLTDSAVDVTPYENGAHDAAMHILRGVSDNRTSDPRTTLRGQVEALEARAVAAEQERDQLKRANEEASETVSSLRAALSAVRANMRISPLYTCLGCGEPRMFPRDLQDLSDKDRPCPKCGSELYREHFREDAAKMVNELRQRADRLQAVLDAETGRKGLPGWTWGGWADPTWQCRWPIALARVQSATDDLNPARAFVYLGALATEVQGVTDALDGMEKATAWARARGYTPESPDLDPATADQIRALWDAGDDIGAVGRYRHLFTPPMDVSDALRAVRKVVDAPVETTEGRKSFFSRYEALIQAERDAVDARLLALSGEEIPE